MSIHILAKRSYSTISTNVILSKAMKFVPLHGWRGAVLESCRSLKMSDQATSLFAPDDLVKFHYQQQLEKLKHVKTEATPGYSKLKELILHRLDGNKDLGHGRLAEAIGIVTKHKPVTTTFQCLSELSDELWYLSGDRSTDTTWYTRRGSLLGVYAACEAFQSLDTSKDFRDTKTLVNKLVSGLENAEYAENSIGEWLDFNVRGTFNVLRTWR